MHLTTDYNAREEEIRKQLSGLFDGMMKTLYKLEGSQFRIEILETPKIQEFIEAHSSALDSSFKQVEMSDTMRHRLERSNYIFSGLKTFHELNEAFPSMTDEDGNRKPFERFLNDVRKVDETYNSNYLKAEYNFVQSSAEMAAKWDGFIQDGDRYYLQYRTAGDDKVRQEHKELDRVTLPITDSFWEEFYPPNGWNCRCTVVQVRKSKYPVTPHDEAMALGEEALGKDTKDIFRFNPGKENKTVPDYNPYTIRKCKDCDVAKKLELVAYIPDNELCAACKIIREMAKKYDDVPTERGKVRIHGSHGKNEKAENVRVACHLANKHAYEIDLLPKENRRKDADSYNRTLGYKQEYKVSSTPTVGSIDSLIRKGKSQADSLVLMIDCNISLGELRNAVTDRVKRSPGLRNITFVMGEKDVTYTREQMIEDSFKIKQEDFE